MKKKQILAMGMSAALLCAGSALAADAEKAPTAPVKVESEKAATGTEAAEVQMGVRIGAMVSVTSVQKEADGYKSMLAQDREGRGKSNSIWTKRLWLSTMKQVFHLR